MRDELNPVLKPWWKPDRRYCRRTADGWPFSFSSHIKAEIMSGEMAAGEGRCGNEGTGTGGEGEVELTRRVE